MGDYERFEAFKKSRQPMERCTDPLGNLIETTFDAERMPLCDYRVKCYWCTQYEQGKYKSKQNNRWGWHKANWHRCKKRNRLIEDLNDKHYCNEIEFKEEIKL